VLIAHLFFLDLTPFPQDANSILHYFSSEKHPTLWHAIPAIERLQSAWEAKRDHPRYELYSDALTDGLEKIQKYYLRFDQKPAYIISLGRSQRSISALLTLRDSSTSVLQAQLHTDGVGWSEGAARKDRKGQSGRKGLASRSTNGRRRHGVFRFP
jgi:hypothetical protein